MTRITACGDCGESFEVEKAKGRLPARCKPCFQKFSRERHYRWRLENPEKWRAVQSRASAKRLADPEHRREKRERETFRLYGLTPEAFQALVEKQGGVCAICGATPPPPDDSKPLPRGHASTRLHTDHCHTTGRVRGLLCGKCNTMIGLANEDPAVLLTAVEYLKE